ncbi:MAG TPA: hypothetical protein PKY80_02000 [Syntrophales bacterium]|jgi:homoserine O-acetyltransferase|nr:hypothetical protein [Syntrophales bacterium]
MSVLKNSPRRIDSNDVVHRSIMADPTRRDGHDPDFGRPEKGPAIARMIGRITFMSDPSMEEKFPGD